jgi:hypothetical protein
MDNNQDLLQVLEGIRMELKTLNRTLSGMAPQQGHISSRPAGPSRSSSGPARSAGPARTGGYKRKSDDGEPVGYGAEMGARFPKKRGPVKPKSKASGKPAKKGSGYPKKAK